MTCPINESGHPYGRIPAGGGFGSHTEYEVGFRVIGEALHCILGSLCRAPQGHRTEAAHICEEMAVIETALAEYARSLYVADLMEHPYREKTAASLLEKGEKLIFTASRAREDLGECLLPRAIHALADSTYDALTVLGTNAARAGVALGIGRKSNRAPRHLPLHLRKQLRLRVNDYVRAFARGNPN